MALEFSICPLTGSRLTESLISNTLQELSLKTTLLPPVFFRRWIFLSSRTLILSVRGFPLELARYFGDLNLILQRNDILRFIIGSRFHFPIVPFPLGKSGLGSAYPCHTTNRVGFSDWVVFVAWLTEVNVEE